MKYNKIFKAQDPLFIKNLFTQKKRVLFDNVADKKIKSIQIERVSPSWAKDTCLVKYKVTFENHLIKTLRATSSKKESKEDVYKIMQYLYKKLPIANAVYFDKNHNILFYKEIPGRTLTEIMEKKEKRILSQSLKKAALFLAKLHNLKPKSPFSNAFFPQSTGYTYIFKKIKTSLPELKKEIPSLKTLKFVDKIWKNQNALIHNDFYPGNIIVGKAELYVIDFDKAGRGPALMDLATIMASFNLPKEIWQIKLSQRDRDKLQDIFIKTYCKSQHIDFKKTKTQLKKFLAKIFLDQIRYYFLLDSKNLPKMTKQNRRKFGQKIRSLIINFNKAYENFI